MTCPKPRRSTVMLLLWLFACLALAVACEKKDEGGQGEGAESAAEGGHSHDGAGHGPHDGTVGRLVGGQGFVELKLHDDKGDLELWIARDEAFTEPIDLPLTARPVVTFTGKDDKQATLAVRNTEHNEDEDGTPNIRDGATNYFIFPGDSGQPADWLMGKDFESEVFVEFEHDGQSVESELFVLAPHGHAH